MHGWIRKLNEASINEGGRQQTENEQAVKREEYSVLKILELTTFQKIFQPRSFAIILKNSAPRLQWDERNGK